MYASLYLHIFKFHILVSTFFSRFLENWWILGRRLFDEKRRVIGLSGNSETSTICSSVRAGRTDRCSMQVSYFDAAFVFAVFSGQRLAAHKSNVMHEFYRDNKFISFASVVQKWFSRYFYSDFGVYTRNEDSSPHPLFARYKWQLISCTSSTDLRNGLLGANVGWFTINHASEKWKLMLQHFRLQISF